MRRFEFSEGSSSKFWTGGVEDNKLIVIYGKLGTEGKREDKIFPNAAAAQKECDKKIAEKVKKGYAEVVAGAAAPVVVAPKEPEAPKRPVLPARYETVKPSAEKVSAAISALEGLQKSLGGRSWRVAQQAQQARRALGLIPGYKPSTTKNFSAVFESLMRAVIAKEKRLPLRHAINLLVELDAEAFTHALQLWKEAPQGPAVVTIAAMVKQHETLGDAEVALRLGSLLADRSSPEAAISRRWGSFKPHFDAYLTFKGETPKGYLKSIETAGDKQLARRITALK